MSTETHLALLARIANLEHRLRKAHARTYAQKQRARHWRLRALAQTRFQR